MDGNAIYDGLYTEAGRPPGLHEGYVVSAIPGPNMYRVWTPHLGQCVAAYYLNAAGGGVLSGDRNNTGIPPGTGVLVSVPIDESGAVFDIGAQIVNVLPSHEALVPPPEAGEGEELAVNFDPVYMTHLIPLQSQVIRDLSDEDYDRGSQRHGSRADTIIYDSGIGNAAGGVSRMSLLGAELKACEQAGVEAHVLGRLLKLIGFNMSVLTGGGLERMVSRMGEYSELKYLVPYLWEARGGALSEGGWSPYIPRLVEARGFAGDLHTEMVQIPSDGTGRMPDGARLLTEQKTFDGGYYLEGVGEILMGRCNPGEPITIEEFVDQHAPDTPAGGIPEEEADEQNIWNEPPPEVDRRVDRIVVDGEEYVPSPAGEEEDPTHDQMANYSAYGAPEQVKHRRQQRLRALAQSIACEMSEEEVDLGDLGMQVIEDVDHRSDVQLYVPGDMESFWMWTRGNVWMLNNGETKLVVGPYGSQWYGNYELATFAMHNCMGGDVVNITSRYRTNLRCQDLMLQPRHMTVANGLVRGEWQPGRSVSEVTSVDITVYQWVDEQWQEIASRSMSGNMETGTVDIPVDDLDVDGDLPMKGPVKVCVTDSETGSYVESFIEWAAGKLMMAEAQEDMTSDGTTYQVSKLLSSGGTGESLQAMRAPGQVIRRKQMVMVLPTDGEHHMAVLAGGQVELRNDDPANPRTGQMWLREDMV